jgi:hypothetical protein
MSRNFTLLASTRNRIARVHPSVLRAGRAVASGSPVSSSFSPANCSLQERLATQIAGWLHREPFLSLTGGRTR